ncbi:zinc transporter ZIP10-like isoform X2 [Tachypleus tridentatus]|uniref:zinc transporter ZIP10-like isoform X2 n=1 Tax=Tachypleus tridentatus TaxID=6853 RepID=UPI003FD480BA
MRSRMTELFCVCLLVSCLTCKTLGSESRYYHPLHCRHRPRRLRSLVEEHGDHPSIVEKKFDHHIYVQKLFDKYGKNGVITFKGFKHLLDNLGIRKVLINHNLEPHFDDQMRYHKTVEHNDHEHMLIKEQKASYGHEREHADLSRDITEGDSPLHIPEFKELSDNKTVNGDRTNVSDHHHPSLVVGGRCLTTSELLSAFDLQPESKLTPAEFFNFCPAIIYELDKEHCKHLPVYNSHVPTHHDHEKENVETINNHLSSSVWGYASIAVMSISLCGMLSVAVVPVMHKWFYHALLQFLVGLGVGSLSGDAFLHLLPHAIAGEHIHSHTEEHYTNEESILIWRGLIALIGIYMLFVAEKSLNMFTGYCQKKMSTKGGQLPNLLVVFRKIDRERCQAVGEKLSHHRQSSCDYTTDPATLKDLERFMEKKKVEKRNSLSPLDDNCHVMMEKNIPAEEECHRETLVFRHDSTDHSYVVTMTDHHHHQGMHGHNHDIPSSVSAVAWMVIMGDGFHNFCDGMAIGAAFSSGMSSGLSTTVAVFCHELPHELGDFAMLLKAGMSVRQALFYNGISSFLCFFGMVIGLAIGNISTASMWIFSAAAGMFLYIALVDMLPELSASPTQLKNRSKNQLIIQLLGISFGITIMLVIALYEHDLMQLIS